MKSAWEIRSSIKQLVNGRSDAVKAEAKEIMDAVRRMEEFADSELSAARGEISRLQDALEHAQINEDAVSRIGEEIIHAAQGDAHNLEDVLRRLGVPAMEARRAAELCQRQSEEAA